MGRKYLKLNKNRNSSRGHQGSLNSLFNFLNAHIEPMDNAEFMGLALNYVDFIFSETKRPRLIEMTELFRKYSDDLGTDSPSEDLDRIKRFFGALQSHLHMKIESFMNAVERKESGIVLEMEPKWRVVVDPSSGFFVEDFSFPKSGGDLDLGTEKQLAETRLFNIIRNLGLRADRFRKCSRARCRKFFYQPSAREKRFCSTRCVKAVVQAAYAKRKQDRKR